MLNKPAIFRGWFNPRSAPSPYGADGWHLEHLTDICEPGYDVVGDEGIRVKALALIETEHDPKYRKKYASLWHNKSHQP